MSQWLRPERGWGLTNCIRRSCARFYTAKAKTARVVDALSGAVARYAPVFCSGVTSSLSNI